MFQSTHPRGVRLLNFFYEIYSSKFQSTHPRGVRLSVGSPLLSASTFQSTHPRGVRLFASRDYSRVNHVSIHAPTRGATRLGPVCFRQQTVSIHAPTRGATVASSGALVG